MESLINSNEQLKTLLEEMLKTSSASNVNSNQFDRQHVGEFGIMKGLMFRLNLHDRQEVRYWKEKALLTEKRLHNQGKQREQKLQDDLSSVQLRIQKRRGINACSIDENHNVYNTSNLDRTTFSNIDNLTRYSDQCFDSESYRRGESTQNIDTSFHTPKKNNNSSKHENVEDDNLRYVSYVSCTSGNASQATSRNAFQVTLSTDNEDIVDINAINGILDSDGDKSQLKLPEKQLECVEAVSLENSVSIQNNVGEKEIREVRMFVSPLPVEELAPEVLEQMESLHLLQEQQKELDEWYENMQMQLELEKVHLNQKYDELRLRNIKEQTHIIENSQDFLKSASVVTNSIKNASIRSSLTPPKPVSIEERNENELANLSRNSSLNSSLKRRKRLLPSPPNEGSMSASPVENNNKLILSQDMVFTNGSEVSESVTRDVFSDLKLRRKSRPIRFFNTPISEDRYTPVCNRSNGWDTLLDVKEQQQVDSSASTSTPQETVVGKQLVHELSPVSANYEWSPPRNDLSNDKSNHRPVGKCKPIGKEQAAFVMTALAKGFLIRQLMKTNKVQEITKTIKDTDQFLRDIDKENKNSKKKLNHVDRQLRMRIQDELSTKRKKLHDIFFNMKAAEQMKLLAASRIHLKEKQLQQQLSSSLHESKGGRTNDHKKLSVASQRSIKRRKENLINDNQARPKTAPEKINGVNNAIQREQKPLRPIQSCTSPLLSERRRPNSAASDSHGNRSGKKPVNKKLNMNAVSNSQTQRVMAAKLSKRYSHVI